MVNVESGKEDVPSRRPTPDIENSDTFWHIDQYLSCQTSFLDGKVHTKK